MSQLSFGTRLAHAWNAFLNKGPTARYYQNIGPGLSYRADKPRLVTKGDRTIITSIYNRISMDCASVDIRHVKLDENGRLKDYVKSGLDNCLTIEANIDQTGRAFVQDIVLSMLDEGCVAVVPVDTDISPDKTGGFDIKTLRTGRIIQWYPEHVTVNLFNEQKQIREDITLSKRSVAIIENPFYSVMNAPNSTLQRLIRKLTLMDIVDEQNRSGKLDLIIQLPYIVKSDMKKAQANQRRQEIEDQLTGSKYGIAYTDGTEKITQLNRPVENNLLQQVESLTTQLYNQLCLTAEIMNGTADEQTYLNYNNRVIEPIMSAIADEFKRKFLTKTARSQSHSIEYFRDPFRLVPVNQMAEIADKFTRNEIMSSNEVRQIIGLKPSDDPRADALINKNISQPDGMMDQQGMEDEMPVDGEETAEDLNPNDTEFGGYATDEDLEEISSLEQELSDLDSQLSEVPKSDDEDDKNLQNEMDEYDRLLDELELKFKTEKGSLKHYASPYYDPVKAHEYYERTKQLKGRTTMASLTDEGKSIARTVKKTLESEKKAKIKDHKSSTNSAISSSKKSTQDETNSYKSQGKSERSENSKAMQARISERKESLRAQIAQKKEQLKQQQKANNEQMKANVDAANKNKDDQIKAEKARVKEQVKNTNAQMKSKITQLRNYINSMSAADRKTFRDKVNDQISALREENSENRTALNDASKETQSTIKETAKNQTTKLKEDTKEANSKLKDTHDNEVASLKEQNRQADTEDREKTKSSNESISDRVKEQTSAANERHKETTSELREAHSTRKEEIKEEYAEKYQEELDKIGAEYTKESTSKKKRLKTKSDFEREGLKYPGKK